jgi:hypothetical protein
MTTARAEFEAWFYAKFSKEPQNPSLQMVAKAIADEAYSAAWQYQQSRIDALEARLKEAERRAEILLHQKLIADARVERSARILGKIYSYVTPPLLVAPDGKTYRYRDPDAADHLNKLSDVIRGIPDEIAAIDAMAKTADQQSGEGST